MSSFRPLRVTIPSPWLSMSSSGCPRLAYSDLHCYDIRPFPVCAPGTTASMTPGHKLFVARASTLTGPPGVRHNSFAAQPPDLLLRFYVYPLGFEVSCLLTHRLASYPVSVRRFLGFATPLPPLLPLLVAACGSLHLAVNTRDGTFTRKNRAMPGTHEKAAPVAGQVPPDKNRND